jgi:N6-L-threonylcarbamoyladenine synthase
MIVLGIDTSCDDTGVGVARGREVLSNVVVSQTAVHAAFGGVVPERASREHLSVIDEVVGRALDEAGVTLDDLGAVAATRGPGLAGTLLVGFGYAKALAWARDLPFVPVHHLEGHVAASLAGTELAPPFLCLIASGGHTVLFDVPEVGHYVRLGGSLDDAAGEAFDKVARSLDLPYPGGPALAALAEEGDPEAVPLPVPMKGRQGYDLSFSGLKTAVAVYLERHPDARAADVARAFQDRVVTSLVDVATRAARDLGRGDLVVSCGVAANRALREALAGMGVRVHLPPPPLATDNGAMIALAAAATLGRASARGEAADPSTDAPDDMLDALAADVAPYLPLGHAPTRPRDATVRRRG